MLLTALIISYVGREWGFIWTTDPLLHLMLKKKILLAGNCKRTWTSSLPQRPLGISYIAEGDDVAVYCLLLLLSSSETCRAVYHQVYSATPLYLVCWISSKAHVFLSFMSFAAQYADRNCGGKVIARQVEMLKGRLKHSFFTGGSFSIVWNQPLLWQPTAE